MTYQEALTTLRWTAREAIAEAEKAQQTAEAWKMVCTTLDVAAAAENAPSEIEKQCVEARAALADINRERAAVSSARAEHSEIRQQIKIEQAKLDGIQAELAEAKAVISEAEEKRGLLELASKLRNLTN